MQFLLDMSAVKLQEKENIRYSSFIAWASAGPLRGLSRKIKSAKRKPNA
jgi:hypothetical protein